MTTAKSAAGLAGVIPLLIADVGLWIAPQGVTVRSGTPTNAESSTGNGIIAGETAICTVGQSGVGLTYRGYDIADLAANATFEEVAYLLIYGHLPNQKELTRSMRQMKKLRDLPAAVKAVLEQIPSSVNPMDVLRAGCSMLGAPEAENRFQTPQQAADRLLRPSRL